jgi:hypothetical protein
MGKSKLKTLPGLFDISGQQSKAVFYKYIIHLLFSLQEKASQEVVFIRRDQTGF